jgi:hypothetical protein
VILYPANASIAAMVCRTDEVQKLGILRGLMMNYSWLGSNSAVPYVPLETPSLGLAPATSSLFLILF